MPAIAVNPPFPLFTDADGQPLDDAYIYIGTANQNPVSNPITVYWDSALTVTAAQPIRTSNGYPMRNGTPARFYTASDYSILVRDKNGAFVYTAASETDFISSEFVTFTAAGAGAVQRTAQAKLRDFVSVKDYGAVGDGVTDDSPFFAAAVAAVGIGGALFIPVGNYRLASQVDLSAVSMCGVGRDSKIICAVSSGKCLKIDATSVAQNTFYKNFWLYGNSNADFGISVTNTFGKILFENIYFSNFTKAGSVALRFGNSWSFDVIRCHFTDNVNDIAGQELTSELNPVFSTANLVNEVVISSCKFETSSGTRIKNAAGNGWQIAENFFGSACVDVIYFGGSTVNPTFDNRITGNDIEASPSGAAITFLSVAPQSCYNNNVAFNRINQDVNIFRCVNVNRTFFINNFFLSSLTGGKKQLTTDANCGDIWFIEPTSNSTFQTIASGTVYYLGQSGNITNNVISPKGGVDFSSTSLSADANRLDAYVESTWTPALRIGGGTTGITYSSRSGEYTRIGNLVFAAFHIVLTNKGALTGNLSIAGLPITASSSVFNGAWGGLSPVNSLGYGVSLAASNGGTVIDVMRRQTTGADLTDADINNSSDIRGTIVYRV